MKSFQWGDIMSVFYRNNYKQNRRSWGVEYTFGINDFSGGLNNKYIDSAINDKEVSDSKNMMFEDGVLMAKRNGFEQYNMSRYTAPIRHVGRWERLGATVIISGNRMYIDYDGGTSTTVLPWDAGATTLEYGDICSGVEFQGRYWLADEYRLIMVRDDLQCYVVTEDPICRVTSSSVVVEEEEVILSWVLTDLTDMTINSFGSIYGEPYQVGTTTYYEGKVTFTGATVGAEGSVTATWTTQPDSTTHQMKVQLMGNPQHIRLTSINEGVVVGGEPIVGAPMYLYEPLPENYVEGVVKWSETGSVYKVHYQPCIQELSDAYAGESYIPANPKYLAVHKNRLCIVGDDTQKNCVFMSRTSNPLYYPTSTAFIMPDPQPINNMFVFDGALVAGSKYNIYAIYGNSEGYNKDKLFSLSKMDVTTGFMCHNCGDIIQNYYMFLGTDKKFHLLTTPTTNVEYLMVKDAGDKIDLEKEPFGFGEFNECEVQALSKDNEMYFNITVNDWNCVVVYNYTLMAYTYLVGFDAVALLDRGEYILFSNTNHKVFKWKPHVTEDERVFKDATATAATFNPISARLKTKKYQPYGNVRQKYFKQITVTAHIYDDVQSNITTDIIIENTVIPVGVMRANWPGYGSAYFNEARYYVGVDNLHHGRWHNLDKRGLTVQFDFKNSTIDEGMKIVNSTIIYKTRDTR